MAQFIAQWAFAANEIKPRFPGNVQLKDDRSRNYLLLYKIFQTHDAFSIKNYAEQLQKTYVLFVPGFLSSATTKVAPYFSEVMAELDQRGVANQRVNFSNESSPQENALYVRDAIINIPDHFNIVLISHSKGSIDTLEALLRYPELQDKVKGWIPIQSSFYGSHVANIVRDTWYLDLGANIAMNKLGISPIALEYQRTDVRTIYMNRHYMNQNIPQLLNKVPILTFASSIDDRWFPDTSLEITRDYILRQGQANDGLVAVSDAHLLGTDFVVVKDVDHSMPVMPSLGLRFNRIAFFDAMMTILLFRTSVR